ncbi:MAG: molybdopterin molybdotransferase MoeA [Anaerolineae bacterium]|nr:molybdopterin molybdotransferase MoeA [Gemmatimonadaceae bacterium]
MLTVPEASARILADIRKLPAEKIPLLDTLGRVLAQSVVSPLTLPPWDNSAMDGYAVLAADISGATAEAPITLPVRETVAAGAFPSGPIRAGLAVRIMTGAPIPEGTDTVVRVEDTDGGVDSVVVRDARDAGKNLRFRGEDLRKGQTVMAPGAPLSAAQIGVLASVGASEVDVYRRPRVAILGSGNELVDLDRFDEAVSGSKIVSSNSYTMHAMIRAAGGIPVDLGIARDDPADLRARLERATGCDLIVTTAGVSVGEFDYVRDVLAGLGAEMKFWKIRMRPGAPLGFGALNEVPWIGLPGNPVSVMVTFDLFVRPVIRRMLGYTRLFRRALPVQLEEPVTIGAKLTHFLRGVVRVRADGTLSARLTGPQGSGILTSMAAANALIIVPPERPRAEAGETVNAFLLGEDASLSEEFTL